MAHSSFDRPRHRAIAKALYALDAEKLADAQCFFGGGTAISLMLGEYRESLDIDFLCATREGWRLLRNHIADGLAPLAPGIEVVRDVRHSANASRAVIRVDGIDIKIEFVREGRVTLDGAMSDLLGVPTLSKGALQAQKLLANADRGMDASTNHRDLIDFAMMTRHWGPPSEEVMGSAVAEYGAQIASSFHSVFAQLYQGQTLARCLKNMKAEPNLQSDILSALEAGMMRLPLSSTEHDEQQARRQSVGRLPCVR